MDESLPFQGREELLKSFKVPTRPVTRAKDGRTFHWLHSFIYEGENQASRQLDHFIHPSNFGPREQSYGVSMAAAIWMNRLPTNGNRSRFGCGSKPIKSLPR